MFSRYLAYIFIAVLPLKSLAWFDLGHEVVGEIAWTQLNAQTRDKVNELLKQLSPLYEEASSLATLAKLPDHIRSGFKIFDSWHYIALPWVQIPSEPPAPSTNNALWALCECTRNLAPAKPKTPDDPFGWSPKPFEKAFMLPFFVHIVGDLHQPLHAITRYSAALPEGDKSGLLFPLRLGNSVTNLHLFWDSGAGFFSDVRDKFAIMTGKSPQTEELAERIMKEFPKKHFGSKIEQVVFREWAQDSYNLAKSVAYDLTEGSEPSKAYIEKSQKLVKERIALAGYRLAHLLTELLSENGSALATGCVF